jgi:hypothetical protein
VTIISEKLIGGELKLSNAGVDVWPFKQLTLESGKAIGNIEISGCKAGQRTAVRSLWEFVMTLA